MEELLNKDARFAHVSKDPKFRRIPKSERKVKIDKRFRSMFEDKKFTVKYTIDKRGRPINQDSTENLKKYYELSSSEEDEERTVQSHERVKKKKSSDPVAAEKNIQKQDRENLLNSQRSDITDTVEQTESTSIGKGRVNDFRIDYARGEGGPLLTDSSSEEESDDDNEPGSSRDEETIEHHWGELDKEADRTDEITHRLAICNMDWDRIRAVDLMVLFHSFLPPGGFLKSVTIYPSEFGIERMKEEECKGPPELVNSDTKQDDFSVDDENENGSEYQMEKMRQYQLNRLKYYYAVLECDSAETANKIYTECDGIEYESTSTKLDLRFIPDDMDFDREPREVCDKLPQLSKYQPRIFTTTALQQVKVDLTWDETNPERQEITEKINSGKLEDLCEDDIQAYLASETSDDDDVDNNHSTDMLEKKEDNSRESKDTEKQNPIDKYKLLLSSIENEEKKKKDEQVELEFTWGLGDRDKTEKLVREKIRKSENLTPFEQYLEKRREKKRAKRKKEQTEQSSSEDSVPSDIDLDDPYFADEMKNCNKEKDPVKSKKKKTRVRARDNYNDDDDDDEKSREKAQLELLLLDKDDQNGKTHFDIKKMEETDSLTKSKKKRIDKKNKKKKQDNDTNRNDDEEFKVDVADPRFNALYTSHHYNIDPADPHYRKTKGTEALVKEKLKRRNVDEQVELVQKEPRIIGKQRKMSDDLAALVKSVKRNTANISKPIK